MSTSFVPYLDIINDAPSEDALLSASRTILLTAEEEFRQLISTTYKDSCSAEIIRSLLNSIRFRLNAAENVLDASSVLSDLRQCFTPVHTPVPEQDSAIEDDSPF